MDGKHTKVVKAPIASLCFMLTCLTAVISCIGGCGQESAPEQLTLYSIDGVRDPRNMPKAEEQFHGYPVLGKIEVTDAKVRQEIMAAIKDGMARSDGALPKCFWPRHAIRAFEKGKKIDYVICFECLQLQIHANGTPQTEPTTREPQSVLNKHLKAAGIPIAP